MVKLKRPPFKAAFSSLRSVAGSILRWPLSPARLDRAYEDLSDVEDCSGLTHRIHEYTPDPSERKEEIPIWPEAVAVTASPDYAKCVVWQVQ